jgi:2-(1,2-epoxy-1,2-dihydrophenyl)acetyl-CoA isomerase
MVSPNTDRNDESSVLLDVSGGVATITLNRPDRLNALNLDLATNLNRAVHEIESRSDVNVVILRGAGRGFCAGGDIADMAAADDPSAFLERLVGEMNDAIAVLTELSAVVVSLVHGVVAGGGIGLMLAADIVLADPASRFLAAYPAIGLTPDCGMTVFLPQAVGTARALSFALSAEPLTAQLAFDWGMVTEVVDEGALDRRGNERASELATYPAQVVAQTRRLLRGDPADLRERLERERKSIAAMAGIEAAEELIGRFAARGRDAEEAPRRHPRIEGEV